MEVIVFLVIGGFVLVLFMFYLILRKAVVGFKDGFESSRGK